MLRSVALCFFLGSALFAAGCGDSGSDRDKQKGESKPGGGVGGEVEEDSSETGKAIAALLKDDRDFELADLKNEVNCDPIVGKADKVDEVFMPWPKALKNMLVSYLKTSPITERMIASIQGAYLVDANVLGGDIGGITCFENTDKKGLIFVNAGLSVDARQQGGVGVYQPVSGVAETYMLVSLRDYAAATIVHEGMHAIDFHEYLHGSDANSTARDKLADLSWTDFDHPKDAERISVLTLADAAPAARAGGMANAWKGFHCTRSVLGGLSAFGLSASSGDTLAKEFKYLAEDTNFIVPYTMTNALEDFAETLTIYQFATRSKLYDVRQIYDKDLTRTAPEEAKKIYEHNVETILGAQAKQRDKMCALASAVFGEDCKLPEVK